MHKNLQLNEVICPYVREDLENTQIWQIEPLKKSFIQCALLSAKDYSDSPFFAEKKYVLQNLNLPRELCAIGYTAVYI